MTHLKETDLYTPIKSFLEGLGYEVKGEVERCDLVAIRGDEMVVVELKTRFNLELVLQGVQRLTLTETVYLAVEAPRSTRREPRWREVQALCRRLGLGLITVRFSGPGARVDVLLDPGPYQARPNEKRRGELLKEFARRTGDYNTGGSTGRPIVTAYREATLRLAAYLQMHGPSRVKTMSVDAGVANAASILQKNYYDWFVRVERGTYALTSQGEQALREYADVVGPTRR